ncbi:uncharacterized protein LOC141904723 isoform X2 [Tubulanus polymorphus]|uniref:uncharacterized protein LOC141904723 isoform X2 n=1 Tax=Tubulanus polymorphus TaxID=672921 RepID=UPI003DA69BB3
MLEYTKPGGNMRLVNIIKGIPRLRALWDILMKLPQYSEVLMQTMLDPVKAEKLLRMLSTNWKELCLTADLNTVFVIPTMSNVDMTQLQQTLCTMNVSLLLQDLNEMNLQHMGSLESLVSGQPMPPFNTTAVVQMAWKLYQAFPKNSSMLMESYFHFNLTSMPLIDVTNWQRVLDSVTKYAINKFGALNETAGVLKLLNDLNPLIINAVNESAPALAMYNKVMAVLKNMMSLFEKYVVYLTDPSAGLKILAGASNSEVLKLQSALYNAPDIFGLLLNAVINPEKSVPILFNVLSGNPDVKSAVCASNIDWKQYFPVPAAGKINGAQLKKILCSLNITLLGEQFAAPEIIQTMTLLENPAANPGTTSLTTIASTVTNLMKVSEKLAYFSDNATKVFPYSDPAKWKMVIDNFMQKVTILGSNPQAQVQKIMATISAITPLLNQGIKPPTSGIFKAITVILDMLVTKLESVNQTDISVTEFFAKSPQTQSMIRFLQNRFPVVFETLLLSADTKRFEKLRNMTNATEALITVCHPFLDINNYIVAPKGVNLTELKTEFCSVDFMKLQAELMNEFEVGKIQAELVSTTPMQWIQLAQVLMRANVQITKWTKLPPKVVTHPWMNSSLWIDIFTRFGNERNDTQSIFKQIVQTYSALIPLLDNSTHAKSAAFVLDKLLTAFIGQVSGLLMPGATYTLENLTANLPQLRNIVNIALNESPTIIDALMKAPFRNPAVLMKLLTSKNWRADLCSGGLVAALNVGPEVNATRIEELFCKINETKMSEELMLAYGFDRVLAAVMQILMPNFSPKIDWLRLLAKSKKFLDLLMAVIANPPKFIPPNLTADRYQRVIDNFMKTVNLQDLKTFYPLIKVFDGLLKNTTLYESMAPMYAAMTYVLDFTNTVLGMTKVTNQTLDIGGLFTNMQKIRAMMTTVAKMHPQLLDNLMAVSFKLDKVVPLVLMTVSLKSVVCNESLIDEYMFYPPAITASDIKSAFCNISDPALSAEIEKQFNIKNLVAKVKAASQGLTKFDLLKFVEAEWKLYTNIQALATITGVAFNGKPLEFKFNSSLPITLTMYIQNLPRLSIPTFAAIMEEFMPVIENTEFWRVVRPHLELVNVVVKIINQKMTDINPQNITLGSILKSAGYTKMTIQNAFKMSPDIVNMLFTVSVDPTKALREAVSNPSRPWPETLKAMFCDPKNSILSTADQTTVKSTLCSVNGMMMMVELTRAFSVDKMLQQIAAITSNATYTKQFNWTEYLLNVQELEKNSFNLAARIRTPNLVDFFAYSGNISAWLERLQKAGLMPQLSADQIIQLLVSSLDHFTPYLNHNTTWGRTALAVLKSVQFTTSLIKDKLKSITSANPITLDDLFKNTTQLKDIMKTVFGLSVPQIQSLLTAKIDFIKLMSLLRVPDPVAAFCTVNIAALIRPSGVSVDLPKFQKKLCNLNSTLLVDELAKSYNVEAIKIHWEKAIAAQLDPVRIDWNQSLIQYARLTAIVQSIVLNPPKIDPTITNAFDVNKTILPVLNTIQQTLTKYFNLNPNDPNSFTTMLQAFGAPIVALQNVPEAKPLFTALAVVKTTVDYVNEMTSKLTVNLVDKTVELSSIVKNVTKIQQILRLTMNLGPDFVNGFLATQWKLNMVIPFISTQSMLQTNTQLIERIFCNETLMANVIHFSPGFDTKLMKDAFCTWNNTEILAQLQQQFDIARITQQVQLALGTSQVDFGRFLQSVQKLQANILSLMGLKGVKLMGKDVVKYFNMSVVVNVPMIPFIQQLPKAEAVVFGNYLQQLDAAFLRVQFWAQIRQSLNLVVMIADVLYNRTNAIHSSGLSLGSVFGNSPIVNKFLAETYRLTPDMVKIVMSASMQPATTLKLAVNNGNFVQLICGNEIMLPKSANENEIRRLLCTTNFTSLSLELRKLIKFDVILKQIKALNQPSMKPLNWTRAIESVQRLYTSYSQLLRAIRLPTMSEFFKQTGTTDAKWTNNVLNALKMIPVRVEDIPLLVSEGIRVALYGLQNVPGTRPLLEMIYKYGQLYQGIVKMLIKQLTPFQTKVTLDMLVRNITEIKRFIQGNILMSPAELDAVFSMNVDVGKLSILMTNPNPCAVDWNSILIIPAGKSQKPLTKIQMTACMNATLIYEKLKSEFNIQAYIHLLQQPPTGRLNWTQVVLDSAHLVDLIMKMLKKPPTVGDQLLNMADYTRYQTAIQTLLQRFNRSFTTQDMLMFGQALDELSAVLKRSPQGRAALQALDVVDFYLKFINTRLEQALKEPITLKLMLKSATIMRDYLTSVARFDARAATVLLNSEISPLFLYNLMNDFKNGALNESTLKDRLCSTPLHSWLKLPANQMQQKITIEELHKQICRLATPAFMQQLENEFEIRNAMQIHRMGPNGNFTSMLMNQQQLQHLITKMIQSSPSIGKSLKMLFNTTNWLETLQELTKMDPKRLLSLMASIGSAYENIDPSFKEIMLQVSSVLDSMKISKYFLEKAGSPSRIENLLSNNTAIKELVDTLFAQLSPDSIALSDYNKAFYRVSATVIAKEKSMQDIICKPDTLESYLSATLYMNVTAMSAAICGIPGENWSSALKSAGFNTGEYIFLVQLLSFKFLIQNGSSIDGIVKRLLPPNDWAKMKSNLLSIVDVFTALNKLPSGVKWQLDLEKYLPVMSHISELIQKKFWDLAVLYLNYVDPFLRRENFWNEMKKNIAIQANVYEQFNKILKSLGPHTKISLSRILPNSTALANILKPYLSPSDTASLLTAVVNPERFSQFLMANEKAAVNMMCNAVFFQETFLFGDNSVISADAIQTAMCNALKSDSLRFGKIVKLIRMTDFVNAVTAAITKPADLTRNPFVYYVTEFQKWMTSFAQVMNSTGIDTVDLANWFKPIEIALNATKTMNNESINAACQATVKMLSPQMVEMIANLTDGTLTIYEIFAEKMNIIEPNIADVICSLKNLNISGLLELVNKLKIQETVKRFENLFSKPAHFSCQRTYNVISEYVAAVERFSKSDLFEKVHQCHAGQAQPSILKTIDAAFEMGATVAKLLSDPALKEFLNIMDIEMILRPLLSQKSVTLKMAKLFTSEAKASEILVDALKLAPEVAFSLLGATVTVDLRHLGNKSDEALKDTLCKPENLAKAISFSPLLNVDYKKITDSICTENVTSNIRKFRDAVNIGYVIVRAFESSGLAITDVALISDIVKYAGDIIKRSQSLIDLFAILNDFSTEKALEILPRIQRFIMDNQPDKIFDSIVSLLQTFEEIGKDPSTKRVMNILAKLANGVKSLHVYKTFMPLNVALKDVVKSPEDFADYLVSIGLTKNASEALMMAPFSYLQVLVANNKANINELICNATNLGKILTVSNTPTLSIEDISRHLCSIDRKLIVNITETVLRNLDIGRLIQTAMNMGINGLLRKSNVSAESMKEMMQAMKPMKEHLAEVMYTVANMTNDIPSLDTSTIGSDPPSASGAMKSISRMMCGMENMFSVNDEMNVAGKIGQSAEQKKADNLSDSYLNEVKILKDAKKSEFCIDIFKTIRDLPAGPVIWAFFKPFLMGKVAFTPNTPLTRRIMSSANSTYEELASLIDMLKSVNKNVQYLEKLSDMGPKLDIIKKSMANPMVGAAMMSITGVDGTELIDSLSYMTTVSRNDTARIKQLAGLTLNFTECMDVNRYVGVSSEKELQTVTAKWAKERKLLGGIVFEFGQQQNRKKRAANNTITAGTLPKFVRYKIRVDVDNTMNTDTSWLAFTRPGPGDNFAEDLRYLRGFLPLQDMIDRAIIKEQTGKDVKIPIQTQQFPYPCYMKDSFLSFVYKFLLPLMMIITWITFIGIAIKSLVYDRETGIEEVMKVMGMSSVVNFVSWFITNFLLMMALLLVIVLVMKVSSLLPYSNPLILILLFMDFSFSTLMMCYMVSAFFNRSNLAALVGILFYLMSYQAYIITEALEVKMTFWQQILASLFSTSAFSFSTVHVTRAEDRGVGIQWSNTKDTYVLSLMTFEWGCIMMFVDGLIYFVIGWYVRNIYPGKYGTPRPWYFPLTPSYWNCFCSQKKPTKMENKYGIGQYVNPIYESDEKGACLTKGIRSTEPSTADILDENEVHEREPREFPIGISIQNLTKRYGKCCRKKKVAVDGLNLNLFEGQVTAFLGHNGAGKTSTINILTGITPPSSGTAFIDGKDVTTRYDSIRKSLGFCPQQNVLYKDMSVKEHLEMFAKIKGNMPRWQQKEDVESMLINTGLYNLQDEKVRNISGGMKRRLSIAIAFIGGSKVVILDEPTAGVDPAARRSIWDIISKYKKNCTVLLSTHHLEEADVLGDRIAIIHRGRLLCSGSSMFLKKRYGQGYHLNISKMDKIQNGKDSVQCSAEAIMNFVGGHVEGAYLLEEVGREIRIILPNKEKAKFQHLFMEMNDNVTNLSIAGYGVSDTLLEEVFMNVCTMADMGKPVHPDNLTQLHGHFTVDKISPDASKVDEKEATAKNIETTVNIQNKVTNEHDTGCLLKMRQFGALLGKRFHHHRRYMWGYLSHILMPLICVTFAIWTATYNINLSKLPARRMLPELYGPNLPAFVKNSNPSVSMNSKLINALVSDPGPSVSCMNNFNRTKEWMYQEYQCLSNTNATFDTPAVDQVMAIKYNKKPSCHCTSDRLKCPAGASGLPVPRVKTKTSTTVYDLTGRNITDWILTTWQKFIYNRYGGWEFGNPKSTAVNDQTATIWFYNRGIHALPGFYNGFTNAMLRANLNVTQNPNDYGILTVNDPLYFNEEQLSQENLKNRAASVGVTVMILVAFCFIPASLAVFIVKERITSEKHLQTLYGVTPMLYWISTFFWDLIIFAIPVALSIAIMRAFNLDIFAAKQNLGGTAAILMLFGWAILPLTYLLSRCYKDGTTAYLTTFMFYLMGGVLLLFTVFILEVFSTNSEVIKAVYGVVGYIVYAFPPYTLCEALIQLGRNQVISSLFERFGQDTYNSPFSAEVMGWHCVALAVEGFVFFVINLLCECDYLCCHAMPKKLPNSDLEDDDVSLERQRVVGKESNNDVISIHELSKIYRSGRQRVLAVDQLTVGIPEKECFGLLGVNGAGKTSTFSMITGAIMPSAGQIFFTGHDVTYKKGAMAQNVGYCPQFDALDLQMTGLEILNFYGTLKGIKSKELKQSVDDIVKVLELQDYLDMVISQYSGGTKRRLSIAVALLGKPTLIMLDEPTAGMDVKMRQLVRNYIVNSRLTVILSSHRMDECEAMCSKLAIMVNGHFQCIGSPQHLRNKFGEGYTLQLRLSTDASPALVAAFIKGRFPGTILKDQHLNFLEFSIPHSTSMLPSIFGHIEREKDKQGIEDYSVSQTTLDQVFFNFSRSQGDGLLSDDSFSDSDDARSSLKDSDIHVQEHRGSGRFVPSSFSNLAYASKDDPLEPKIIGDKQVDAHPAVFDTRL